MRNREVIEREMYDAREDLEQSLTALRHVVQEKVDVKARARVAVEKGRQRARDLYTRGRETVEERPLLIASIAAGAIAAGAFVYIARKREWF